MKTTKNVKANTTAKSTGAEKSETSRLVSAVKNLKAVLPNITDKRLANKVSKALTAKTSTANSLEKLLDEVIKSGMPKKAVVENEVKTKKTIKKSTPKEEPKTETKVAKKPVAKKSEEKATAKKPTATKKESPVKSVKTTGDVKPPIALLFPDTLTKEIDGEKVTLRKAEDDEFTTLAEIAEATEEGKIIVMAGFWSARHIKEYDYTRTFMVSKAPKSFPDDLDLAQGVTISEMNKKFFAMSIYTEGMYVFYESELAPIEDVNPYTGEKFSVRVSNGMEFAVYVAD